MAKASRNASHSHRWTHLLAWALALPVAFPLQPAQAASVLSFISSPYSLVGLGETVNAGPDNGFDFGVLGDPSSGLLFSIAKPWTSDPSFRYWNLDLAPAQGASLAVGSFAEATRSAFKDATDAGLEFSGNHRGNNRLTGSFNILESSFDVDRVLSFAVDFLQYDDESANRWIKGALRYNSDVPVSLIPEPIVIDPPVDLADNPDHPLPPPLVYVPSPSEYEVPPYSWPICACLEMVSPPPYATFELYQAPTPVDLYLAPTPGPMPIAAALAGWHSARRLRRRCRERSQQGAMPAGFPHS